MYERRIRKEQPVHLLPLPDDDEDGWKSLEQDITMDHLNTRFVDAIDTGDNDDNHSGIPPDSNTMKIIQKKDPKAIDRTTLVDKNLVQTAVQSALASITASSPHDDQQVVVPIPILPQGLINPTPLFQNYEYIPLGDSEGPFHWQTPGEIFNRLPIYWSNPDNHQLKSSGQRDRYAHGQRAANMTYMEIATKSVLDAMTSKDNMMELCFGSLQANQYITRLQGKFICCL